MQSAKDSVNKFMAKAGHHDTTVHETVAPAVQHETVKPMLHENVTTATDREVHQDHYHHTVQPVKDREVLAEQHSHNMGDVEHREFDHRDHDRTKQKLAQVNSGFRDERQVHDTKHTQSAAPAVGGEHVHHHIHETIQPIVHKETIQPNVVHTTVPIHEVHHNAASHHDTTELPALSMNEFKKKGGALGGREEKYDGFEGEPKNIGGALGAGHTAGHSSHTHGTHEHGSHHAGATGAGLTGAGVGTAGNHGHADRTGQTGAAGTIAREAEQHRHGGVQGQGQGLRTDDEKYGNVSGQHHGTDGAIGSNGARGSHTDATDSQPTNASKPSMMQKLNPFADSDKDGKKGFMD
ncbi:hypothetical protein K504DRAFT_485143 [Pleomassaria siparia CBS 279.74]|uniref:Allergen n=1 Tax=Pleomassaria siparia CBS 279.74 TaxID=1314801 RepID=A0A6G1JW54_9PLEO|nr:hypothetical protein K504DRAFT_485143 [Pleomassaria siparia CBS 279.74]